MYKKFSMYKMFITTAKSKNSFIFSLPTQSAEKVYFVTFAMVSVFMVLVYKIFSSTFDGLYVQPGMLCFLFLLFNVAYFIFYVNYLLTQINTFRTTVSTICFILF